MDIHEIHAKMQRDRRPAPITRRALWNTFPPALRCAALVVLLLWFGDVGPRFIEAIFSPEPPAIVEHFSRDEVLAAFRGSDGGEAGLARLIAGPHLVTGFTAEGVTHFRGVTDTDLQVATEYARTIYRIRHRSMNTFRIILIIVGSIALCFVGYRWHDVALFVIPIYNIGLFFKLAWRLASLPARPWAAAPPVDPA